MGDRRLLVEREILRVIGKTFRGGSRCDNGHKLVLS